jgi:hypothetical protein
MTTPIVYLMRGLPGCGKSHTAHRLAGSDGIVLETDQFFYNEVGEDNENYDFREELLPAAREWNANRLRAAIAKGISPIVIDRGNGLNVETREFAIIAVDHGYSVELAEPDSPWWQELRVLLKHREFVAADLFDQWADALSKQTRSNHRVPAATIRRWMSKWRHDLTVDEILDVT